MVLVLLKQMRPNFLLDTFLIYSIVEDYHIKDNKYAYIKAMLRRYLEGLDFQ